MLNDDDDEVRDAAAQTVAKLITLQGQKSNSRPIVPILASHSLTAFLVSTFAGSKELCGEALRRMIGAPAHRKLFRSFAEALAEARQEDNALFSTEKQNLFKDDTMDAALWCRVLKSLRPAPVSTKLSWGLHTWVVGALAALTEIAKDEVDGALGWTTRKEVFTLGVRVICAADVVLEWRPNDSTIRAALRRFADAGAVSEVNGLWLERAEQVLENSVTDRMRSVWSSLRFLTM